MHFLSIWMLARIHVEDCSKLNFVTVLSQSKKPTYDSGSFSLIIDLDLAMSPSRPIYPSIYRQTDLSILSIDPGSKDACVHQ